MQRALPGAARAAGSAFALVLAACQIPATGMPTGWTDVTGVGCGLEGVALTPETRRQHGPLAVDDKRQVSFVVGPLTAPCGETGTRQFERVDWVADLASLEPFLGARLVDCEACTLEYEGRPGNEFMRSGVYGAALLQRGTQRLTFEIAGVRPGVGQLRVIACEGRASCIGHFPSAEEVLNVEVLARVD